MTEAMEDSELKFHTLSHHPFFSRLTEDQLRKLANIAILERRKCGSIIVSQDELVDSFFIIIKGRVDIYPKPEGIAEGTAIPSLILYEGESIGLGPEGFYSSTGKRTATAIACYETTLLKVSLDDFHTFIVENPGIKLHEDVVKKHLRRVQFLREVTPFMHMSLEQLYRTSLYIREVGYAADSVIFEQGDIGDNCYLINSGKVEIKIKSNKGEVKQLAILEPPAIFGEAALILQEPRNATAIATENCELFAIDREHLMELFASDQSLRDALNALLLDRHRPRTNPAVEVHTHMSSEGEEVYTLKNKTDLKYMRLSDKGWFVWNQLDGTNTIRDIVVDFFINFHIFSPGFICNLIMMLEKDGFIENAAADFTKPETVVYDTFWKQVRQSISNFLKHRIIFRNIDPLMGKLYQKGGFILFNPLFFVTFLLASIIGFSSYIGVAPIALNVISTYHHSWLLILFVIAVRYGTVLLHEIGHCMAVKHYGKTINRMGFGWYNLSPVAFADTSDMWLAPNKERFLVDLAGVYIDLIIATLFAFAAFFVTQPLICAALWILSTSHYLSFVENLSPLGNYDGYYAITDRLNYHNIRKMAYFKLLAALNLAKPSAQAASVPSIVPILFCSYYLVYILVVSFIMASFQYYVIIAFLPLKWQTFLYAFKYTFAILFAFILTTGILFVLKEGRRYLGILKASAQD